MKRPVCIFHIMQGSFLHGGTPRKLLSLVSNGNSDEFRHCFLFFANSSNNLNREYRNAGAIIEEVYRPHNWDLRFLFDILRVCKKHRCDIITTHFARADIYGTIAGSLNNTPVVKYVHGISWNDSRLLQKIDGILSPLRACTLCNSEATRHEVIRQTAANNTKVIHNGVINTSISLTSSQRAIKKCELNIPDDAFAIIHVGGMIEEREQSVIIQALKHCLTAGINAYLILVGDGPLRNKLESASTELVLSKRIRFLGYRSDISELNAISNVFVNMARKEGFGIAVVEAMQAGIPVVVAKAGALPELIENGVSGILVPVGDSYELAGALIRLATDSDFARSIGNGGRLRAQTHFSIDRYVADIEQLYSDIISACHE